MPLGVLSMEGLGRSARPLDLDLAIVRKAVSEVEIDQALVRNASLRSHALEVLNHVFGKPHGHGLLELGSVRILARLHRGQIVFSLPVIHLDSSALRSRLPCERK